MILTTTPAVEGRPAKQILGIVTGEGVSLKTLNDLGASFQNLGSETSPVSEKTFLINSGLLVTTTSPSAPERRKTSP